MEFLVSKSIISWIKIKYRFEIARSGHTVEAPFIGDIINQQNTHRTAIVRCRDGPEAFLASGIPYLQLHALPIELNRADLKVDADGRDEGRGEGVFAKTEEAAGFTDAGVADEEEFDLFS